LKYKYIYTVLFGLWCQSADKLTIYYVPCSWIFYKPFHQSPHSHFVGQSTCNNSRFEFFQKFCSKLWFKWMVPENGLLSGGLYTGPLCHESFAFTTRPRLLATIFLTFFPFLNFYYLISVISALEYNVFNKTSTI